MCIFYMKIKFYRVVGGWGELYRIFWDFFNFANHHTQYMYVINNIIVQWSRFSVNPGFYPPTLTKCIYLDISII